VAEQAGRPLDAHTLHVIWVGANDLIFGPNASTARQASARLVAQLDTLYDAGARSFFVPLMPDLSRSPMLASDPAEGVNPYQSASMAFNQQLLTDLDAARTRHADAHIVHFDTMAYLNDWLDGPQGSALEQLQACVDGSFYQVDAVCADPGRHVYWDGTHFSAAAHERLGHAFASAVPEPARLAMMAWGLVAVSLVLRRARRLKL
jgi:phospholipase/lecithinase/hemolysin